MDRDSNFSPIKVTRMGGIDQRTAPDQLDDDGRPNFSTLEGLYPKQDGLLARVPGKSLLSSTCAGQIILNIFQPFDSTGNILIQTNSNLYAFTLDELRGRTYTPSISPSSGGEDESMSIAILSDLRANATSGGPLGVFAAQTLTSTGVTSDTETVVIDGKTYTFQTVLTNVDGHVLRGATSAIAYTNLCHAINNSGGTAGTDYAAAMTKHSTVNAANPTATTVVATAITAGTGGNSLATTETLANGAWGAATLAGGALASADTFYDRTINTEEVDVDGITAINSAATNGFVLQVGTYRINVVCVWNPTDAGTSAIGTTIGLYNSTSAAFEVYSGTTEPILSTAGKANTGTYAEASNQELVLDAVFDVASTAKTFKIVQKGSVQAGVRGSSFCGVHDQCTTTANVNGVKSKNRYLLVTIWKQ